MFVTPQSGFEGCVKNRAHFPWCAFRPGARDVMLTGENVNVFTHSDFPPQRESHLHKSPDGISFNKAEANVGGSYIEDFSWDQEQTQYVWYIIF